MFIELSATEKEIIMENSFIHGIKTEIMGKEYGARFIEERNEIDILYYKHNEVQAVVYRYFIGEHMYKVGLNFVIKGKATGKRRK